MWDRDSFESILTCLADIYLNERNEYLTNRFEAAWNVCEFFLPTEPGARMWLAWIFERNIRAGEIYANIDFSREPKVNAISANFHFLQDLCARRNLHENWSAIVSRVAPLSRDRWTISAPGNESIDFCDFECSSSASLQQQLHKQVDRRRKNLAQAVLEDCSISVG